MPQVPGVLVLVIIIIGLYRSGQSLSHIFHYSYAVKFDVDHLQDPEAVKMEEWPPSPSRYTITVPAGWSISFPVCE